LDDRHSTFTISTSSVDCHGDFVERAGIDLPDPLVAFAAP
jgi:hypothetical protein